MKKIRVAHVITRLCEGGATNALATLAEHMDKEQFELHLIYGKTGHGETDGAHQVVGLFEGVTFVEQLQREINFIGDFLSYRYLKNAFKKIQPDIIHTHTSKAGFLGRLAASSLKIPCVHSTHGHIFKANASIPSVGHLSRPFFLALEKFCAKKSKKIFSLSQQEVEDLVSLNVAPPSTFLVLPSTVATDRLQQSRGRRDALRNEWGIKPDEWITILVGRLALEKGHQDMIKALSHGFTGQLWFAGSGPLEEDLKKIVHSNGLSECVKFLGHRSDLHDWLALADVLVLPSHYEGQGLVLVEAMAAGVPVVATRVGGIPEVIEDKVSGLLVSPNCPKEISGAIQALQNDPQLSSQMVEGGDRVVPRFAPEKVVHTLQETYKLLSNL